MFIYFIVICTGPAFCVVTSGMTCVSSLFSLQPHLSWRLPSDTPPTSPLPSTHQSPHSPRLCPPPASLPGTPAAVSARFPHGCSGAPPSGQPLVLLLFPFQMSLGPSPSFSPLLPSLRPSVLGLGTCKALTSDVLASPSLLILLGRRG